MPVVEMFTQENKNLLGKGQDRWHHRCEHHKQNCEEQTSLVGHRFSRIVSNAAVQATNYNRNNNVCLNIKTKKIS